MYILQVVQQAQNLTSLLPLGVFVMALLINVIGIGIFIGIIRRTLADIKEDMGMIKKDLSAHTEDIAGLRERMAVQEYITRGKLTVIIALCVLFMGCSFSKKIKVDEQRATTVSRSDSGQTAIHSNIKTTGSDWWRTTTFYPPVPVSSPVIVGGDTTINNNNYYYPTKVIHEGGTLQIKEAVFDSASFWKRKADSLQTSIVKNDSATKGQIFSVWQLAGLGFLLFIVGMIATKLGGSFKFVRV